MLSLLIITSLFLLAQAPQDANQIKPGYIALFAVILLELFILLFMIGKGMFRLLRQRRNHAVGSRLTLRLFFLFVSLSLLPVFIVYLFSLQFIFKGIDSWLSNEVGSTLNSAFQLSQSVLDNQSHEAMTLTLEMARTLQNIPDQQTPEILYQLRKKHDLYELVITAPDKGIVAFSSAQETLLPTFRFDSTLYKDKISHFDIQQLDNSEALYIRTVTPLKQNDPLTPSYHLSALFPVNLRFSQLVKEIQATYSNYQKVVFLRPILKTSFTITLSLVLLLCLLTAIWTAFYASKRIVSPLRMLAIGTRAIAAGHYKKTLPQTSHDEIGLLVSSFNQMSRNIALARDEANKHQNNVEQQHAYLEAILGNISSGVMVLNRSLELKTINKAAEHILNDSLTPYIDRPINQIGTENNDLRGLFTLFFHQVNEETPKGWQMEYTLPRAKNNRTLACKGTPLIINNNHQGHIILFSDITTLIQAQKNAVWSEVAERLAHEIKNPLTPIQLSAERLSRKYENSTREEFSPILKRSTHTIIQQVDTLKEMLNAFNEYARPPRLNLKTTSFQSLIKEVVDLYYGLSPQALFTLNLEDLPPLPLDAGRIRQLLHNLIKNSLEACPENTLAEIDISTTFKNEGEKNHIVFTLKDNGNGFSEKLLDKVFDPYITNKIKGSGLGLAIAKKIVEEHNGSIQAYNLSSAGACIIIQFPVS